jgi:2,3-bisphosphoglycerate-dependent phosphoglycerate mutase
MGKLILIRHGQSVWNLKNVFTGWVDIPLSEKGIKEAQNAAKLLEKIKIDVAFTSKLERARETLNIVLSKQKKIGVYIHEDSKEKKWALHPKDFTDEEIPVYSDNAINERYYGKLQGLNKDETKKKHGEEQVHIWRRSYDVRPPGGECLKDTCERAIPYFQKKIMPFLKKGKNVIVAAHGNSLRGIIKHIEKISDEDIPNLELPTGKPIIYDYRNGKLIKKK